MALALLGGTEFFMEGSEKPLAYASCMKAEVATVLFVYYGTLLDCL